MNALPLLARPELPANVQGEPEGRYANEPGLSAGVSKPGSESAASGSPWTSTVGLELPSLTAGLPGSRATVCVGPPLSPRGAEAEGGRRGDDDVAVDAVDQAA